MKLRNDKILILGGGSGIGKAIAKRFCELGAKVLIVGRTEDKLLQAKAEIGSDNLYIKAFDITNVDNHIALFEETEKLLGGLSGFVNAAAMSSQAFGRGYEPWDITSEEWDKFTETFERVLQGALKPFDAIRELEISVPTYYRYKKQYEQEHPKAVVSS